MVLILLIVVIDNGSIFSVSRAKTLSYFISIGLSQREWQVLIISFDYKIRHEYYQITTTIPVPAIPCTYSIRSVDIWILVGGFFSLIPLYMLVVLMFFHCAADQRSTICSRFPSLSHLDAGFFTVRWG